MKACRDEWKATQNGLDLSRLVFLDEFGAMTLPLPAYSPDLNPIEKMCSKVKEILRAAKARTFDALLNAIADALKTVTYQDAIGWFLSCGYTTSHS